MKNFQIFPEGYTPPQPKPSLAQRLGINGNIIFIKHQTWFAAEDNDEELITVRFATA